MALRGPLWLLGRCLSTERRDTGRCQVLARRFLNLGLLREDRTRGHVFQAIGAAQRFLTRYPAHRATIDRAPCNRPYRMTGAMLQDWLQWFAAQSGPYGGQNFGFRYNYDTLRGYLTSKYGGTRTGGGGGNNELEIALRLVAHFM